MIAEHALQEMVNDAIAAGQRQRPMPSFDHLPYFAAISREQMARINRVYDEARNACATRRWKR